MNQNSNPSGFRVWTGPATSEVALRAIEIIDAHGARCTVYSVADGFKIKLTVEVSVPVEHARIGFRVLSIDGTIVFSSDDLDSLGSCIADERGCYEIEVAIPPNLLNEGIYTITAAAHVPSVRWLFMETDAIQFELYASDAIGARRLGFFRPDLVWSMNRIRST